jgi:hypothetical protein
MVGFGGGIPSADHDIRLGEIVISCPTGSCGGVVQYDMGKVTADGVFCRTGFLNSPPRPLLTAINNMRAAELTDAPRYPEYLQRAIRRTGRTQANFGRPSSQSDRLFKTEHEHPATGKNCDRCPRVLTDKQRNCHQEFKICNYEQHKDINPGRVSGTCRWVLKNPQYRRWWNSCCNDLLWISADPGCGKSVLAKSLIDDDFKALSPTVSLCYFFFKDKDEQNNLAAALCAILHQLFSQQPNLLQYAVPSWERNGSKLQQEAVNFGVSL